jgi:hypothetical protein
MCSFCRRWKIAASRHHQQLDTFDNAAEDGLHSVFTEHTLHSVFSSGSQK